MLGPAGDHPDTPLCQRNGLQQGTQSALNFNFFKLIFNTFFFILVKDKDIKVKDILLCLSIVIFYSDLLPSNVYYYCHLQQ